MRVTDIRYLYDYSSWANAQLLAVVSRLSPAEFTRHIAGSYGSIRNTLVHVLSAEWGWVDRCGGRRRGDRLKAEDYPTAAVFVETWQRVDGWMHELLAGLTDEDLEEDVGFSFAPGMAGSLPRGQLLQHAVFHAVHHRGQVALLLRAIGHAPGNFDLLIYANERSRIPW
jgi:uncharacterized damage-inducible protein DinB